ncbi:aldo/keto reductase [Methanosarcina sp. KYL-1]|uniref:aldo/keto reductase n=1 Tax=Methanosarcina sp. KYL-1 TaxID=2602068 RepID=UPI0021013443|nr:aldo/keto reductase [Methanosarcina sp. KYL-1]
MGFGCMRLPIIGGDDSRIDEGKAFGMIRYAIDSGINYIDTAHPYHRGRSEPFLGKVLQDGYREKVYLATKLPSWLIKSREDMDRYLDEQLERLRTDHIDFYLVHGLNREFWKNVTEHGIFDFLDSALQDGRIRYAGFSFHDDPEVFKEIIDSYHWAFCQIQYNFMDEDYQAGKEGLMYVASRGLGIVIMEPLRGGSLVSSVPPEVRQIWDSAQVRRNPAEWGLRYLWDYPEISVVLSGMSDMAQVEENIRAADKGCPNSLTEAEKALISRARGIYESRMRVNCTGCQYCMPCPEGVNIPQNFKHLNNAAMFDDVKRAKLLYNIFVPPGKRASNCVECGQCEEKCPQKIPIREMLKEVVKVFGE